MGKLNIAHHKSYHPYRRDNIEKVRRDEEEAEIKRAKEEGRMTLADSEARLSVLRERAGTASSSKSRRREDEKREQELLAQAADPDARREALAPVSSSISGLGSGKHINLFEDLEQSLATSALATSRELQKLGKAKTKEAAELEKGIPLAPNKKDLKPWYSERKKNDDGPVDDSKRSKDLSRKARSDPLTEIQRELQIRYPSQPSSRDNDLSNGRTWGAPPSYPNRSSNLPQEKDPRATRESRESSERTRAQALKERKRREAAGSATPSTVRGDGDAFRYGDQFNARDVAAAHRYREYDDLKERRWDDERRDGRGRDDQKDWRRR
ncbi:hypothetical protein ACEPAG_7175 [Sanghuangporus baumii]